MNNEYSADPIEQLRAWLDTEVVALATATSTGAPSVRMVLLKDADERGLLFFTNYEGRKGRELAENPHAAMLFHMPGRQITAWVSRQSEPIESREELDRSYAEFDAAHPEELGRPPHWGGFRLFPETYEFWEHHENRLHDRLRYRRAGSAWVVERLSP